MAYNTLQVARRYLKSIDVLATDPTKGITQEDLTQAQDDAQARIDGVLAPYYEVSGWSADTPPIVETVAELLSSAQVLRYRYQRDSLGGADAGRFAEVLFDQAGKLLADLKSARLSVVLSDGTVQRMRPGVGSTVPRGSNPEE